MPRLSHSILVALAVTLGLGCSSAEDPSTPVHADEVRKEIKNLNQQRHKEWEESSTDKKSR